MLFLIFMHIFHISSVITIEKEVGNFTVGNHVIKIAFNQKSIKLQYEIIFKLILYGLEIIFDHVIHHPVFTTAYIYTVQLDL